MNTFQNQTLQEEGWKLNYIYPIMQQKSDLRNAKGVVTSYFAKNNNLAKLKSGVD